MAHWWYWVGSGFRLIHPCACALYSLVFSFQFLWGYTTSLPHQCRIWMHLAVFISVYTALNKNSQTVLAARYFCVCFFFFPPEENTLFLCSNDIRMTNPWCSVRTGAIKYRKEQDWEIKFFNYVQKPIITSEMYKEWIAHLLPWFVTVINLLIAALQQVCLIYSDLHEKKQRS